MENPKYILVMRQVASDYDGISHELVQIANNLERMDQFNPQQKLFSLVHHLKLFLAYQIPIWESAGQTGKGLFIPGRKPQFL